MIQINILNIQRQFRTKNNPLKKQSYGLHLESSFYATISLRFSAFSKEPLRSRFVYAYLFFHSREWIVDSRVSFKLKVTNWILKRLCCLLNTKYIDLVIGIFFLSNFFISDLELNCGVTFTGNLIEKSSFCLATQLEANE